jgi:undecaprenyl phosphate N,N'-diacetylbacillosamine 1-phosphate transferase
MYKSFFKRFFDIVLSLLGLVIISPIFLLIWLFLAIANKGARAFLYKSGQGRVRGYSSY